MKRRYLIPLLLAWMLAMPCFAETLLIAAAAGYKRPIAELSSAFEKKTGIRVEQIYGHMAGVIAQAKQSGEVSIIFGDLAYLDKAEGLNFAEFIPVGEGRLVVGWPKGGELKTVSELVAPRFARIALPDTRAAIYGLASSEFLQRSGLDAKLKDHLQVVATVPQVSAYLIAGEVDAGFFNLTEALAIKDKIGGYVEIDRTLYSPIRIVGALVKGFEEQPATRAFRTFLASPDARAIVARHGL